MTTYTFSDIGSLLNAKVLQHASNPEVDVILTDSRKLMQPANTIFFTIHGRNRSANRYIESLYLKGVRCFVVDPSFKLYEEFPEGNFLGVDDTIASLQHLASKHRHRFHLPVIGITGSNGKTVVKEWLDQLLHTTFNIAKSPKSYNSQIGVPLSVWQLTETHNLAIFEAGISTSGEMEKLEAVIRPTIGVVTSIGDAHAAGFAGLEEKIREKLMLFVHSELLIFNSDNFLLSEEVKSLVQQNPSLKVFTWARQGSSDLLVEKIERVVNATSITCRRDNNTFNFQIPFTDNASVENAISCCAVLLCLGIPLGDIKEKFHHLRAVEMRLEMKAGINNCSVINDSYSSDMNSLLIALDFLGQQKQHSKRTLILSDFVQQIQDPAKLYSKVSDLLQRRLVTKLVGIGEIISANKSSFQSIPETEFYSDTEDFLESFSTTSFSGETILLKGARKFAFERISSLLEERTHESILEINLNAIRHNLRFYMDRLSHGVKMMAMVKAFSYGTGSFEIASILESSGVDYLAVAYADEGIELRRSGVRLPVMVMNAEEAGFDNLVKYKLEPELYSFKIANAFISFLESREITGYPVHVKLDTGMHRLGFEMADMGNLIALLKDSIQLKVASVFSHLAGSDEPSLDEFTKQQSALFIEMCGMLEESLGFKTIKHLANSSAIVRHPSLQFDMVRLGIGLYGVDNDSQIQKNLQHVATLKTTISQIRTVKKGESVGYNRAGMVDADTTVATVRVGYADGYPRSLGNGKGQMLVNGKYARVIGNICMDMTMLDISGIDAREGDPVIVFGAHPTVTELADWAGTIPYEMLTGVSQRVKRVYFND